jgi:hypothetical protein
MVMAEILHLGDEVEIVTDDFTGQGAPRGSIGVIVDDWADGSNDVEVRDPRTGEVLARVRASVDEIRLYNGPELVREPRKHGIIFGRGDELGDDVEEPPMSAGFALLQIPGYTPAPMAFSQPPTEEADLEGDIPWELKDEPPTGPIFH